MRSTLAMAAAGLLAACTAEDPPQVSPETVEAAVDRAQLEMERAVRPVRKPAPERSR